jgi:hypothetical protein
MGNQRTQAGLIGGLMGGAGAAMGAPGKAHGGMIHSGPRSQMASAMNMQSGGHVPGQAQVAGDSPKNDTVPAVLSPGEIVIPRTVVKQGPDAAARFVAAVLAKHGKQ